MTPNARQAAWREIKHDLQTCAPSDIRHKHPDSHGIVTAAAGAELLVNAWIMIARLRHVGCALPVQVFHGETERVPAAIRQAFDAQTTFIAIADEGVAGYAYKPLALERSSFDACLWLDADNTPLVDPSPLFDIATDALAWPDAFRFNRAVVYDVFDELSTDAPEIEAGQLLIRTRACADVLGAVVRLNREHRAIAWSDMLGDKDTFRVAFHARRRDLTIVSQTPTVVGTLGRALRPQRDSSGRFQLIATHYHENALIQHGPDGRALFLHRTGSPWSLSARFRPLTWSFPLEAPIREHIGDWSPHAVQPVDPRALEADAWCARKFDQVAWFYEACGMPGWQLALRRALCKRRVAQRYVYPESKFGA